MSSTREQILGVRFWNGTVASAVAEANAAGSCIVVPASPALTKLSYDIAYRDALQQADLVLPDSELLAFLSRVVARRPLRKISGIDYLTGLIGSDSFQEGGSVLWVVGSEQSREKTAAWLRSKSLLTGQTVHVLPTGTASPAQHALLLEIEEQRPQHVIIALRGGGQEELGVYLRDYLLYRPKIHCVGAALGFLTGDEQPLPLWTQKHHLSWLARIFSQPGMLLPRLGIALTLAWMIFRYRSELPPLKTRWSEV